MTATISEKVQAKSLPAEKTQSPIELALSTARRDFQQLTSEACTRSKNSLASYNFHGKQLAIINSLECTIYGEFAEKLFHRKYEEALQVKQTLKSAADVIGECSTDLIQAFNRRKVKYDLLHVRSKLIGLQGISWYLEELVACDKRLCAGELGKQTFPSYFSEQLEKLKFAAKKDLTSPDPEAFKILSYVLSARKFHFTESAFLSADSIAQSVSEGAFKRKHSTFFYTLSLVSELERFGQNGLKAALETSFMSIQCLAVSILKHTSIQLFEIWKKTEGDLEKESLSNSLLEYAHTAARCGREAAPECLTHFVDVANQLSVFQLDKSRKLSKENNATTYLETISNIKALINLSNKLEQPAPELSKSLESAISEYLEVISTQLETLKCDWSLEEIKKLFDSLQALNKTLPQENQNIINSFIDTELNELFSLCKESSGKLFANILSGLSSSIADSQTPSPERGGQFEKMLRCLRDVQNMASAFNKEGSTPLLQSADDLAKNMLTEVAELFEKDPNIHFNLAAHLGIRIEKLIDQSPATLIEFETSINRTTAELDTLGLALTPLRESALVKSETGVESLTKLLEHLDELKKYLLDYKSSLLQLNSSS